MTIIQSKAAIPRDCDACGAVLPADLARHDHRCPECRRPVSGPDWTGSLRHVLKVAVGIIVQGFTGLLYLLFPPGSSLGAWLLYAGLSFLGFLYMFIGARAWHTESRERDRELAITAAFEPERLPFHSTLCPGCHHDLSRAVATGRRRCPACRRHFTLRELGGKHVDHAGEPATLSPHERRIAGPLFAVAVFAGLVIVLLAVASLGSGAGGGGGSTPTP